MIDQLRISNLGVIHDATLDLAPGLTVLTGETGAGKTMVLSGLGLLLGARADAALVRRDTDRAFVEGTIEIAATHPACQRAQEAGADLSDGLILARTVGADGRSRAHAGGRTVPAGVLAEIGEQLVAVHGQADQWRLRRTSEHRSLLDGFGDKALTAARTAYDHSLAEYRQVSDDLVALRAAVSETSRRAEQLRDGLALIEEVDPQPGEDNELRADAERLGNVEHLRAAAHQAHSLLSGDDSDGHGITDLLGVARAALASAAEHDPVLADLERRLADCGYLLADLAADMSGYLADIDADPTRLAWVEERRAQLSAMVRRLGSDVDDVLAWGASAAHELARLDTSDEQLRRLHAQLASATTQLTTAASALTAARRAAAKELGRLITTQLRHLAMPKATVTIEVRPDLDLPPERFAIHGIDTVEIMLAPGAGSSARSITKAASGGELSRLMLAIEVVLATRTAASVPTFVFDEVDAGIGGRAAIDVGARLADLARHAQVIVVTHLAQVAAYADRHLVVLKDDSGQVTASTVRAVVGEERLRELSRMMGGDPDSPAGRAHAQELLNQTGC